MSAPPSARNEERTLYLQVTWELAQWVYVRPSTWQAITWQNSRGKKVMGLPMLRLNLEFWLPNFILVSAFPLPFMNIYLQWTTQTRTLGRRLSNHNIFWKQKILKFFCKQTNKIQGSTMQPFELTWPLSKQPSNSWMLLVHLQ